MFVGSKPSLQTLLRICYKFVEGVRAKLCAASVGVSRNTAMEWYGICRGACSHALLSAVTQIGEPGVEVQIDETLISRRKYNRGRPRRQLWVVGMYETRRRKALFELVNNRSWEALRPVIRKWVAAGSGIVTDERKGYTRLPSEGYMQYTVNRSRGFVNPATGRHTNAIEADWSRLKRKLHESGLVCGRAVWAHRDEDQYRLWFDIRGDNMAASWENFLRHWAEAYPIECGRYLRPHGL
nr:unnamed protein product [Spirometra erinaceieuropaei]